MTAAGGAAPATRQCTCCVDPGLHLLRRVDERQVHDRRAAVVGDPVRAHRVEDRLRLDLAQADVDAGVGGHRPREAPAVAVEHRQRPQVHRVPRHAPVDDVRQRVEIRAAVMVDDALRVAGGAGRVVERDRVPLVRRVLPGVLGIAVGDERLVVDGAEALAAGTLRVDDVDDERLLREQRQRLFDRRREFGVGDEHPGLAVLEHERERLGVEPGVERVEHAAGHRHAEMRLDHFRRVGGHQRHRVADADPGLARAPRRAGGCARRSRPRCSGARRGPRRDGAGTCRPCARSATAATAACSWRGCGRGRGRRDSRGSWRVRARGAVGRRAAMILRSRRSGATDALPVAASRCCPASRRERADATALRRCPPRASRMLPRAPSGTDHGPSPLENRHAHRRRRHDRPRRRHARGQGFGAHRRDRRHRRAQLDAGAAAVRAAARRRRPLPHERPARSLRPGRRIVDPGTCRGHRCPCRAPRGGRRALQRRPRPAEGVHPAGRNPRGGDRARRAHRLPPGRAHAGPHGRRRAGQRPGAPLRQPALGPAVRSRPDPEPRRPAGPTCSGGKIAPTTPSTNPERTTPPVVCMGCVQRSH